MQYASKFGKLSSGHRTGKVSLHSNPKERHLIDTILDNSRYNKYNQYGLTINDVEPIYALVKAIDPEAFNNRREEAKASKDEEDY